jgi:hypothetical protein
MANTSSENYNRDMEKIQELFEYRRRAFEFISQAIQCEETGDNQSLAQSLYRVNHKTIFKWNFVTL